VFKQGGADALHGGTIGTDNVTSEFAISARQWPAGEGNLGLYGTNIALGTYGSPAAVTINGNTLVSQYSLTTQQLCPTPFSGYGGYTIPIAINALLAMCSSILLEFNIYVSSSDITNALTGVRCQAGDGLIARGNVVADNIPINYNASVTTQLILTKGTEYTAASTVINVGIYSSGGRMDVADTAYYGQVQYRNLVSLIGFP
jgi:hypothetical protein